jgi:ATP/maltotriose-dependent transcriptional regulator MalT
LQHEAGRDQAGDWRDVLAVALVTGDVSVPSLARFADVTRAEAAQALREATQAGALTGDAIAPDHVGELADRLSPDRVAAVHAAVALHRMAAGPEQFESALEHARQARTADQSELVRLATRSGRLALATGDHETAALLLGAAVELGDDDDPASRARLLFDLARATDGRGGIADARDLLSEVVRLADAAGDRDMVVDAAVRSAFPADWRAGDRRTAALLDLAERLDAGGDRAGAILAARAIVEMRIPAAAEDENQVAWVTRAGVAHPLADQALELTHGTSSPDRLLALSAWRSTHRSPAFLQRRLAVSREGLDLAQRLLDHDALVGIAVFLAVDTLEAGDRTEYDQALATVRWAAETDGNPRLRWWAATVTAGAAILDGDLDAADRHRAAALEIGRRHELPGWVSAEMMLAAEVALAADDDAACRGFLVPSDTTILASPIARSSVASMAARLGERDIALDHARIAFRALDDESSWLLCLTLLAATAAEAGDAVLAAAVAERLAPWTGHLAVDSGAWWCAGPVDLTLAELAAAAGKLGEAAELLAATAPTVRAVGDVRSERRVERLRRLLGDPSTGAATRTAQGPAAVPGLDLLSDRERAVLALIARGRTNAAIGTELAYSASTIRADTVSIYRKLQVTGRAEAAALAVSAGLADPAG